MDENLNKNKLNWNKNKLKGNIAEKIVEFLINSMPDWKCNQFGVETHIEGIKDTVRKIENTLTNKIRRMPDFVCINEKKQEVFFIEVKYRPNSGMRGYLFKFLTEYDKYWEGTKLIIVRQSEPHFVWVDLKKLNISTMRKMDPQGEFWNFGELEQDIKTLFPDLKEENVRKAITAIPREGN